MDYTSSAYPFRLRMQRNHRSWRSIFTNQGGAMERVRGRLPIDQEGARPMSSASLRQFKKSRPETSGLFNSNVMIFYDRISKRIILGGEELCVKKRYISLRTVEATVLREFQKETSGIKKRLAAADLLFLRKIILRKFDLETIGKILGSLVKKGILECEKIIIHDQTVEVFKIKQEVKMVKTAKKSKVKKKKEKVEKKKKKK